MTAALSDVKDVHITNVNRKLYAKFKALCRAEDVSVNTKLKQMIERETKERKEG